VEELFEARPPRASAVLSEISGIVSLKSKKERVEIMVMGQELEQDQYDIPNKYELLVKKGDKVKAKQVIARSRRDKGSIKAKIDGKVFKAEKNEIVIKHSEKQVKTYTFDHREHLQVANRQLIAKGTPLNRGHLNLQELMQLTDAYQVQRYIMTEVQHIYASQGQTINDKHIEIIVKQMFSKIRVINPGDSEFLPGETLSAAKFERINEKLCKGKKEEMAGERLLMGISRVAIMTDSWLSAASFQETIRVLVEASTTKMVDLLKGLKENVIIGKLIPAGEVYRKHFEQEKENKK